MDDNALQKVADRVAIEEVLTRYCRGIDRCDPDELARAFAHDAQIDYGNGPKPVGETIEGLMAGLGAMRLTQHNIGNVMCEVEGNEARAETYCVALHILPGGGEEPDTELVVGGRYLDRLVKRDGDWRIANRIYIMDWNRQQAATMQDRGGLFDTLGRRGARAPADPSYAWWAGES
ncbi:nuclear transport factor 2 family protein [Erythrobacter rubeus]|uniref:Nuclear transport factor 2 family protein n=1 Tax=Erythrobacter rubeus TaxID=2760803 RepID=A0ABR8KXT5_9SPHN|nr:nuclear transport factor 2 family protein [Erythrobacter rubeus]MBD2842971.1 nuclear transport factor 2 family protein [Erythrobacter rubeus]